MSDIQLKITEHGKKHITWRKISPKKQTQKGQK